MFKVHRLVLPLVLGLSVACADTTTSVPGGGSGASGTGAGSGAAGTAAAAGSAAGGTGAQAGSAAGSAAGTAAGSGAGMESEFECVNQGEINYDCPFNLPPINGSCAPAGECCHRASNRAKIAALGPDEPAVIEYRLNYVDVVNHPQTIGHPTLVMGANSRADICSGEQCLLWRFTEPRQGGEFVQGAGSAEIGVGAYNCDGTYSFYGAEAAPERAESTDKDPGRWQSVTVPTEVDPARQGAQRHHIPWATNRNREVARSIFVWPADNTIDWELATSGFEVTEFDTSEAARDCMGSRDRFDWSTVGGFVSYSPIDGNDTDISNLISQTYCSLLAFGLLPEGKKDMSCKDTTRCMPGTADCPWIKLPDSLCPTTEAEQAIFGCHLGAEGNPNGEEGYPEELNCSGDAPTTALDPDMGASSLGQCCDPLGQSTTLPACNAYRTVQEFVAAAAEITDEPRNDLPPICM